MAERITSRRNRVLVEMERLCSDKSLRREQGLLCGEGTKLLEDALLHRIEVTTVILTEDILAELPDIPNARILEVPTALFQSISTQRSPQGVLFACRQPRMGEHLPIGDFIVLDRVQDPGNVGTVIRTAASLGLDGVILCGNSADPFGPKAVRASMGAVFSIPIFEFHPEMLREECSRMGISLLCAMPAGDAVDIRKTQPAHYAMVVGNEGAGISDRLLAACDGKVQIPMAGGTESLNAAAAAAILLWEMRRRVL